MKICGFEYRWVHIEDPPYHYGVGLDDPEGEYWIVPRYLDRPTLVFFRPHLPREDGKPVMGWGKMEIPELVKFGNSLADLDFYPNIWEKIKDKVKWNIVLRIKWGYLNEFAIRLKGWLGLLRCKKCGKRLKEYPPPHVVLSRCECGGVFNFVRK